MEEGKHDISRKVACGAVGQRHCVCGRTLLWVEGVPVLPANLLERLSAACVPFESSEAKKDVSSCRVWHALMHSLVMLYTPNRN